MPRISVPGILSQDQLPSLALGGYGELLLGVPRPHPLPSLLSVCVQAHLVELVSPKSMLSEGRYGEAFIHSFIHSLATRVIHLLLSVGQAGWRMRAPSGQPQCSVAHVLTQ